jgi:competence protein ComEC
MQLALWSAALAVGIACGLAAGFAAACVLAAIAAVGLGVLVRLRAWNLGLALVAWLVGLGLGYREASLAAAPAPVEEDRLVEVVGQVVHGSDVAEPAPSPVEPRERDAGARRRAHLRIDLAKVDGKSVSATLALLVLDGVPPLEPGDWVRFKCRLYVPRGSANPGLPDGRLLARGQGIDLLATVRSPCEVERIPGSRGMLARARRWAHRLRQAMCHAIARRLDEPAAGFVRTMVAGERGEVPTTVEDGFRAAGATHVLSVSGLHLAVVVALIFQGLKRGLALFPSLALRVAPKALASLLALPATAFYTLLTGEAVATVRSAIMAAVVLGAAVVNRPLSLAASIGAAAMILLVCSPASLLDVSFQLSFASVIGLGLLARRLLADRARGRVVGWRRVGSWLGRSLSASFAACLLTMPMVAHHFGEITPAAPLGNLVLVPMVEMVVLPCGLVGALLALGHPWLGALPLYLAGLAADVALAMAEVFRRLAPVLLVRYPDTREMLLLAGAAGCLLAALRGGGRGRARWLVVAGVAAALGMGSLTARELIRRARNGLVVTFLDVGQGTATLIQGPGGFVALVDGGGRYDDSYDTGARIVEPVLRSAGITRLDLLVLSHAHPDHMNGLRRILERFPVALLWSHGEGGGNPAFAQLLALAERRKVPTPPPGIVARSGLVVEAIGPWYDGRIGVPPGLSTNDGSLIVRLSFAGRTVLLPGDIGEEGESELLALGRTLAADVLAMPHHGSRHASTTPFLAAVSPGLAVASAGRFNRFGLPSPAALARYAERGIRVLRTDRAGAVTVTIDDDSRLGMTCMRGCQP